MRRHENSRERLPVLVTTCGTQLESRPPPHLQCGNGRWDGGTFRPYYRDAQKMLRKAPARGGDITITAGCDCLSKLKSIDILPPSGLKELTVDWEGNNTGQNAVCRITFEQNG